MKTCKVCGEKKPERQFCRRSRLCRECHNAMRRKGNGKNGAGKSKNKHPKRIISICSAPGCTNVVMPKNGRRNPWCSPECMRAIKKDRDRGEYPLPEEIAAECAKIRAARLKESAGSSVAR